MKKIIEIADDIADFYITTYTNRGAALEGHYYVKDMQDYVEEETDDNFESELEQLYWDFDSSSKKGNLSERDCFKMAIRKFRNKIQKRKEAQTADGLTVQEFLKQAWENHKKIEFNSFEKYDGKWSETANPAVEIVGNLILDDNLQGLKHFRIKPEEQKLPDFIKESGYCSLYGHFYYITTVIKNIAYLQRITKYDFISTISTNDVVGLANLKSVKIIPWNDSNAPESFENENGAKYGKCFNADLGIWGYYKQGFGFMTYQYVLDNIKRPNYQICGTFEVVDVK